jgi:hypothetical protein
LALCPPELALLALCPPELALLALCAGPCPPELALLALCTGPGAPPRPKGRQILRRASGPRASPRRVLGPRAKFQCPATVLTPAVLPIAGSLAVRTLAGTYVRRAIGPVLSVRCAFLEF